MEIGATISDRTPAELAKIVRAGQQAGRSRATKTLTVLEKVTFTPGRVHYSITFAGLLFACALNNLI